jgi:hypothetical protein
LPSSGERKQDHVALFKAGLDLDERVVEVAGLDHAADRAREAGYVANAFALLVEDRLDGT